MTTSHSATALALVALFTGCEVYTSPPAAMISAPAPIVTAEVAPPPPAPPPPPPPAVGVANAQPWQGEAAPAPPPPRPPPPPPPQDHIAYSGGQWQYVSDYGWTWVPLGSLPAEVEGVPYTYLYTPSFGWTWYVSPWGWGPYHRGPWVGHAWRPEGWRGAWRAQPHVIEHLRRGGGHRR